jgi:predicted anti-sigma-YlaC factor YlaD
MNHEPFCAREDEVLERVIAGAFPLDPASELRSHVTACASCKDLVTVAAAIRTEAETAKREASLPASGAVWFRVQRRAHRENLERARRTVSLVYASTLATTAFLVLILFGGLEALRTGWLSQGLAEVWKILSAPSAMGVSVPVLVAVMCLLLAPFAVYYAVTEE